MKVTVIGGGPGGMYFSILLKKAIPDCQIDIYERNKADDSFGFGVVFSDETLSEFLNISGRWRPRNRPPGHAVQSAACRPRRERRAQAS